MNRSTLLVIVALLACLLPGRASAAPAKAAPLTLVYGNDVRGELAPCG
jgi:hypothetical protein